MQNFTGLTLKEVEQKIKEDGLNSLPQKRKNFFKIFFHWIISPVSLMLIVAGGLSFYNGAKVDFLIIGVLFLSNFLISIWHENKADKSIKKLQENLNFKVKTLRDSVWTHLDSMQIVAGDIIELEVGTVVPADILLLQANNLNINESVLTGESIPKNKNENDKAFSGSFVTTGMAIGKVIATGPRTSFGKTIISVDGIHKKSSLEKDILSISKFISIVSIVVVILLTTVLLYTDASFESILALDLSLLIAGIPVALPTVMSLIISIGVINLVKKNVVVRRLASLEDLANVDLLLTDKTGTLTENKISVEKIMPFGSYSEKDVIALGAASLFDPENKPFDYAVSEKAKELKIDLYKQVSIIPADSERKRSTAVITIDSVNKAVSLGAAQVIEKLCLLENSVRANFENSIVEAAKKGYSVLAVAINPNGIEEKNMELVGLMFLADRVRSDAKATLEFMNEHGINVKMVTGDNFEISRRVAEALEINGEVYRNSSLNNLDWVNKNFDAIAGFAEVLPQDKYKLVKFAQQKYTVAAAGDGVNDLPAVKAADVGFAVSNSVDALKSTADIVLISSGIAIFKDAIIEAREIFVRLYNYSVYRISESFRIIITIAVIGLIFKAYPLTPIQLIVLAFLNDIPIISLAFDRVKVKAKPSHINAKKRFILSTLFGSVGVANSLILLYVMLTFLHLPWEIIQTVFFLKLTVSGHMLIYLAHTEERWYKFLPSKQVIFATLTTQFIATLLALFGIFTAKISISLIILVWVWSFAWMQIGELMKTLNKKLTASRV
jgi:H+-transporting ATPase